MEPILIEVVHGRIVEALHLVHAVGLNEDGQAIAVFGDPQWRTYWRSAAKPFQAIAVVAMGAADRFGLTPKELAIACGSHAGSADHISTVQSMLAKTGLNESHLQCGIHEPFDAAERERLLSEGKKPSPLNFLRDSEKKPFTLSTVKMQKAVTTPLTNTSSLFRNSFGF